MTATDRLLLGALMIDGAIIALLSLAFTYLYIGDQPFPVATFIGGLFNVGLLWLASATTGGWARFAPLAGWLIVVFVALLGGPGGDGPVLEDWRALALIGFGMGLPAVASWSRRLPTPAGGTASRRVSGPQ